MPDRDEQARRYIAQLGCATPAQCVGRGYCAGTCNAWPPPKRRKILFETNYGMVQTIGAVVQKDADHA